MTKQYANRDAMALDEAGGYYYRHVSAMTGEGLYAKSDIAAELGYRDMQIDRLQTAFIKLGACPVCHKIMKHDIYEPFAHCDCGTSEWTDVDSYPVIKLQKENFDLRQLTYAIVDHVPLVATSNDSIEQQLKSHDHVEAKLEARLQRIRESRRELINRYNLNKGK